MTFPTDLAALYVERAGQQYTPSNGTEGMVFISEWCADCARDKSIREGVELSECDDNEVCTIVAASFRGEAKEWVYGEDGQPRCTAFHEFGTPEPYRCPDTTDMFGGST